MNKIRIKFFVPFLGIALVGCGSDYQTTTELEEILVDNRAVSGYEFIDNIVDVLDVIPLETNQGSLISDWSDNIIVSSDRIFFANYSGDDKVRIFDAVDGRFIKRISPSGEGPGEYSSLKSISYNSFSEELELFSDFQRKELIFDKNGQFLREEVQDLLFESKKHLSRNIVIYGCHIPNGEFLGQEKSYKIVWNDKSKNEWKYFCTIPDNELNFGHFSTPYRFQEMDGKLVWFEPFNEIIKTISLNGIDDRYAIKFTTNPMPQDFWAKKSGFSMMSDDAIKENFPFLRHFFFENDNVIVFPYEYDKILHLLIYSKPQKKVLFNTNQVLVEKWKLPLPFPLNPYQEGLLFLVSSEDFKNLVKHHPDKNSLPAAILKVDKKLRIGDNPVLMKLKLK